ncbi:MAG: PilW family protein [Saccharospirillaceae bacterium]|nr:PilW family protein [Saccharospirillaceae bacterium]MCD8532273.1 PilW family protein [Saccharospirillaceae bacterium]
MMLKKQRGMTLIELMIAAVLGMVVTYFVMNIMISSSRNAMQSDGLAQAQENGRFVLSWLHTETRRAGYIPGITDQRIQPFADLCVAELPLPPANDADCTFEANDRASDRLAIQRTFTLIGSARDTMDCTGVDLTGVRAEGDILTDVYWVERNFVSPDTANDDAYDDVLRCVTYFDGIPVANAQVIANGVEGLQVLYGIRPAEDPDRRTNVSRYVALNDILPVDWDSVRAVRIAVLTRSFSDNTLNRDTRSYILLDSNPASLDPRHTFTFNDQIARHIQTTTVYLPNE